MATEDPQGSAIASILSQASVEATYSGALVEGEKGETIIEGTRGYGEEFMTGQKQRVALPEQIVSSVKALHEKATAKLGAVRFEWVADENKVWIVQLHCVATKSYGRTIYPGNALSYHRFSVEQGLEALRGLIAKISGKNEGIVLVGDVGITSHFGDVLRRAEIPSEIEANSSANVFIVKGKPV